MKHPQLRRARLTVASRTSLTGRCTRTPMLRMAAGELWR